MTPEDFKRLEKQISEDMEQFRKEHAKEIDEVYTIILADIVRTVSDVIFRRYVKNEVLHDEEN